MFSSTVMGHWLPAAAGDLAEGEGVVVIDPELPENRSVSVLEVEDGPTVVRLSPDRAAHLGHAHGERIAADEATERITAAGIALNNPDHLFYLPVEEHASVLAETADEHTRRLSEEDADTFAALAAAAPENDLDEAFVELDHWLVFGTFVEGRLAAAASMFPWRGTRLADLGSSRFPSTGVAVSPGDGAGHGGRGARAGLRAAVPVPARQCAVGCPGPGIRVPPLRRVDRHRRLTWPTSRHRTCPRGTPRKRMATSSETTGRCTPSFARRGGPRVTPPDASRRHPDPAVSANGRVESVSRCGT